MNRTTYRAARRLIRDNGKYATHWMEREVAMHMIDLAQQRDDVLKMRNRWGRYEPTKMRLKLWPVRRCTNSLIALHFVELSVSMSGFDGVAR